MTTSFTIESLGKVASQARIGNHTLVFDQPAVVPGGEDRGASPLDVMALTVGACAHYFAAAYLYGRSLPTEALRVEVAFDKSRDPAPRLGRLALRIRLPEGLDPKHLAGIERAVRNCPAWGTLVHPPDLELTFDAPAAPAFAPTG